MAAGVYRLAGRIGLAIGLGLTEIEPPDFLNRPEAGAGVETSGWLVARGDVELHARGAAGARPRNAGQEQTIGQAGAARHRSDVERQQLDPLR